MSQIKNKGSIQVRKFEPAFAHVACDKFYFSNSKHTIICLYSIILLSSNSKTKFRPVSHTYKTTFPIFFHSVTRVICSYYINI
jgi:hypothetical protein